MTRTGGQCDHCGRTSTPCWRKGPPEKPCLCNACGVRWLVKHSLEGYMPAVKPNASAAAANTASPGPQQQQSTARRGAAVSERSLRKRKERSSTPDEAAVKVLFAGRTQSLEQRSDADAAMTAEYAEPDSLQQLHHGKAKRSQRQRQPLQRSQRAVRQARATDTEKYEVETADAGPFDLPNEPGMCLPIDVNGQQAMEGGFHPFNFPFFPLGLNPYMEGILPHNMQHLCGEAGLHALVNHSADADSYEGEAALGLGAFGPPLGPPLLDDMGHLGLALAAAPASHPETTYSGTSGDATDGNGRAQRAGAKAMVHRKALAASLGMMAPMCESVGAGSGLHQGAELSGAGGIMGSFMSLPQAAGAGLHSSKVNSRLMVDLADAAASLAALHRTSSHLFATPVTASRRPRKQARPVACC